MLRADFAVNVMPKFMKKDTCEEQGSKHREPANFPHPLDNAIDPQLNKWLSAAVILA